MIQRGKTERGDGEGRRREEKERGRQKKETERRDGKGRQKQETER